LGIGGNIMKSLIFDDELVEAASQMMAPITETLTQRTREALERGETPPLVGALTWADMARWIENAKAKKKNQKRERR
jgi:hypothetical protein